MQTITPRDYQLTGINQTRQSFTLGNKNVLYVLPTGGGKTVTFTYITQQSVLKGNTVWIIAHRKELINQASRTLSNFGVNHGIIHPKATPKYSELVQVASVQTLVNRMHNYKKPNLIIVDEAHHATAGMWRKVIEANPQSVVLGVTATPERSDGIGLGDVFDDIVVGPQIYDLIDLGFLVEPIVFRPPMIAELDKVKTHKSDFVREDLAIAMNKQTITGDAIEHYKKYAFGEPTIVFTANVQHAKDVAEQFRKSGFAFYAVDGAMDDNERDYLMSNLGTPSVMGLVSCDLISEGTDIPAVACIILLRPTHSLCLFLQQVGRGLRTIAGKSNCIILDHVGNTIRHGMPTQHRYWSLEGRKKRGKRAKNEENDIQITTCTKCYYTAMKFVICPACGHEVEIHQQSEIEVVDGELVLVVDEKFVLKRRVSQARTREQLMDIALDKGYKTSWVDRILNAREENRVLY